MTSFPAGTQNPKTAPMTRPTKMRFTKLMLFHFCQIFID